MLYINTPITHEDITKWLRTFTKFRAMVPDIENDEIRAEALAVVHAGLFLIAFAESRLQIDVSDEVYDRARELQRGVICRNASTKDEEATTQG